MSHAGTDVRGFWLGVTAYAIWGLSPIYWNLLADVPVIEVLAHRIVWAVPILAAVVVGRGRLSALAAQIRSPKTVAIAAVAVVMLSVNWGIFIWAVSTEHVVEASLGYFINPLLSVALGVVVLRERLSRAQAVAVVMAATGVVYMTARLGAPPWISLVLAGSFATYGLLKKHPEAASALEGLLLEMSWVLVPAIAWIGIGAASGEGRVLGSTSTSALLVGAGLVTAAPLLAFGESAKRIPLSTLGLLQFLTPSLQFLLGVFAYGEAVGADRLIGFGFVWLGLVVLSAEGIVRRRLGATAATRR